tara:strand:+ start:452 stop:742 length:291 start_codon:yes stop_codon:yes gene_type:complete
VHCQDRDFDFFTASAASAASTAACAATTSAVAAAISSHPTPSPTPHAQRWRLAPPQSPFDAELRVVSECAIAALQVFTRAPKACGEQRTTCYGRQA